MHKRPYLWALGVATVTAVVAASAGLVRAQTVPCRLATTGAGEICFAPASVGQAERSMPWVPVDPSLAVTSVAHLPLTQVDVFYVGSSPAIGATLSPFNIIYIFGTIPLTSPAVPDPAPSTPTFLVITESVSNVPFHGLHIQRSVFYDRSRGSSVTTTLYGNWNMYARLPYSQLTMSATTNLGHRALREIGLRIIRAALRSSVHPHFLPNLTHNPAGRSAQ